MEIMDRTMQALALSLNMRRLRQDIISSNIANAETPGYKAKSVDFEKSLARALDIDQQEHMNTNNPNHYNVGSGGTDSFEPEIYDNPNGIVSEDGNTVNRDEEMANLAENKILYDASIQLMNKKLGLMKYAIGSER